MIIGYDMMTAPIFEKKNKKPDISFKIRHLFVSHLAHTRFTQFLTENRNKNHKWKFLKKTILINVQVFFIKHNYVCNDIIIIF